VEHLRARRARAGRARADGRDHPVADGDVSGLAAKRPRSPDDPPRRAHGAPSSPPSRRYRTAIRTLTPLVTCSTIVDLGESATSAAISTPRFTGPGCFTLARSAHCAIRAEY